MMGTVTLLGDWALKGLEFSFLTSFQTASVQTQHPKKKKMTSLSILTLTIYLQVQITFPLLASINYSVKTKRHFPNVLFLM